MAILIVDDEANTREVLRGFLERLGHKTILEAKNGVDALKVAEQGTPKMIIADWEMPQMDGLSLVKNIAQKPQLDHCPFLLITSDLPDSTVEAFHKENPRLDGYLNKPFQTAALGEALNKAYKKRCEAHGTIILVSDKGAPEGLTTSLKDNKGHHWRQVIKVDSLEGLKKNLEAHGRALGALVLDPKTYTSFNTPWLESFKKTQQGTKTLAVCLSRDPAKALPLRTLCEFFLEPDMSQKAWNESLKAMANRQTSSWESETLLSEARTHLKAKKPKEAQKTIKRMLAVDPQNAETLCMMGDAQEGKSAVEFFQKALEVNPYLPHAYIKLLALLKKDKSERVALAQRAVEFCPKSVDVLVMAAVAYGESNQAAKGLEVVDRVLALDADNETALKLKSSLQK